MLTISHNKQLASIKEWFCCWKSIACPYYGGNSIVYYNGHTVCAPGNF